MLFRDVLSLNVAKQPDRWLRQVQGTESRYFRAIGSAEALMAKAKDLGQRWLKGVRWTYNATWAAERFLKQWTKSALLSRLEPMRKFVIALRRHQDAVIAFIDTGVTNAIAEGINRIVKIVKNRASGYRHLDAFSEMIFLTIGDVNLPEQISARFRTL